jgi:hypothetical protein
VEDQSRPPDGKQSTSENSINFNQNDKANIGGQFGVVNGNVHIYDVPASATPEQRFKTALNLLNGNMPRRAEELIRKAVEAGYTSHEVAYYWALSVLSGRSFDHLGQDEFIALQGCSALVNPQHPDQWLNALSVITKFINCLIRQESSGDLNDEEFDLVIREYDGLQDERREEIRRHLDLIMTGALQDRVDAKYAEEVKERRMAGYRKERAWKFFQAIPTSPGAATLSEPQLGAGARAVAVAGATVVVAMLSITFSVALFTRPLPALLFAGGTGGGGYLLALKARSWLVFRERATADRARHGEPAKRTRYALTPPPEADDEDDEYTWGDDDKADDEQRKKLQRRRHFREFIKPYIDACFADENPDGATKRKEWKKDTEGLRSTLAADILRRYSRSDLFVRELRWLVTWHATRAKELWDNGTLRAYRDDLQAARPSDTPVFFGALLMAIGLISGTAALLSVNHRLGLGLLMVVGAGLWALYGSGIDVYAVQRDLHRAESALAGEEYAEEEAAFARWVKALDNRPSDAEMARWLDYDKFHAKNLAMKKCGLTNRDIVAHAILTEADAPCWRARVLFGPPRYSRYRILIFLLTVAGVRQVSLDLDFYNGTIGNERRVNFRYDAISSARVTEVGVRFADGRRHVISLEEEEKDDKKPPKDLDSLVFGQSFRLLLMGGQSIDVVIENFDEGFLDRLREDEESLFELALDSSGVRSALRVLEAVAAEGREWLEQERLRRNVRLSDFKRALNQHPELHWHGEPDGPAALES